MNSTEKSISILLPTIYQRSQANWIPYKDIIKGPLGLFSGLKGTTPRKLQLLISEKMKETFGADAKRQDGKGHPCYNVEFKYQMEEAQYIVPAASDDLDNLEGLQPFLSGSKIVFKRTGYWHTGVLLHKTDGEMDVIQLEKMDDANVFVLKIRSVGRVLGMHPSPMKVDNVFLSGRGVNADNLFYRYSRLADLPVRYNATQLNCDVLATFLMTGRTNWTNFRFVEFTTYVLVEFLRKVP